MSKEIMQEELNDHRKLLSYLQARPQYRPATSGGWFYRYPSNLQAPRAIEAHQLYSKAKRVILDGFRLHFEDGELQRRSAQVLVSLFQLPFRSRKSAKIMADPISGMSSGYKFVRFSDEGNQQRALTEM